MGKTASQASSLSRRGLGGRWERETEGEVSKGTALIEGGHVKGQVFGGGAGRPPPRRPSPATRAPCPARFRRDGIATRFVSGRVLRAPRGAARAGGRRARARRRAWRS